MFSEGLFSALLVCGLGRISTAVTFPPTRRSGGHVPASGLPRRGVLPADRVCASRRGAPRRSGRLGQLASLPGGRTRSIRNSGRKSSRQEQTKTGDRPTVSRESGRQESREQPRSSKRAQWHLTAIDPLTPYPPPPRACRRALNPPLRGVCAPDRFRGRGAPVARWGGGWYRGQ